MLPVSPGRRLLRNIQHSRLLTRLLLAAVGLGVLWVVADNRHVDTKLSRHDRYFISTLLLEHQPPPSCSRSLGLDAPFPLRAVDSNKPTAAEVIPSLLAELRALEAAGPAAKGDIDDRLQCLRKLLDSASAAEWVLTLPAAELTTESGSLLMECWLSGHPVDASVWIAAQADATDHHAWLAASALSKDPELLLAYTESSTASEWTNAVFDYSSREVLRRNPPAAASLAQALPEGERQTQLLKTIACDWLMRDPAAARLWIQSVQPSALRLQLMHVAAEAYVSADSLRRLEWLSRTRQADEGLDNAFKSDVRVEQHAATAQSFSPPSQLSVLSEPRVQ